MHMNIEITLRLMITPTTPIVNSIAESARYQESCGPSICLIPFSHCRIACSIDTPSTLSRLQLVVCSSRSVSDVTRCERLESMSSRQHLRAGNTRRDVGESHIAAPRQSHRSDDRHQQQNRSDLEWQQIVCEQSRAD